MLNYGTNKIFNARIRYKAEYLMLEYGTKQNI